MVFFVSFYIFFVLAVAYSTNELGSELLEAFSHFDWSL